MTDTRGTMRRIVTTAVAIALVGGALGVDLPGNYFDPSVAL